MGEIGEPSLKPVNPVKEGFIFSKWIPEIPENFDKDTEFTAQWTPVTYTFTFDLNGGTIGGSTGNKITSGTYNSKSNKPVNPVRNGYRFDGWSPSVPNIFNGNKTFKAQWTSIIYTYTFDMNGGVSEGSAEDKVYTGLLSAPAEKPQDPTKAHHVFTGWSPTVPETFDADRTFVAQWIIANYTYTFNLDGGNIGLDVTNRITSGPYNTNSITPEDPVRDNYTFAGWSPNVPARYDQDRTFIALWIPLTYTFTFDLNEGNIDGDTTSRITSGAYNSHSYKPVDPEREHYTFEGWSPEVPNKFDEDRTFTALWTPLNYTFTFNLDGGSIGGDTSNQLISGIYNTSSSTPPDPIKEHYTFLGWSPEIPDKFDIDRTFIAQWVIENYTITYNFNGGKFEGSTQNQIRTVSYNTMPPILEPDDSDETFLGWTPEFEVVTKDQTYTAMWAIPMELQFKKTYIDEDVLIPIRMTSGNFVMISNNGEEFIKYTTDAPRINNNVPINTPFTVKVVGRATRFFRGAEYNPTNETRQMYKIVDWGQLGLEEIGQAFYQCTDMVGPIPSPHKYSFINLTRANNAFYNCNKLTGEIPEDLFENSPKLYEIWGLFRQCSSLTGTIPEDLFAYNPKLTSISQLFTSCSNLTGAIPEGLFKNNREITTLSSVFSGCVNLTSIPENLFDNNPYVTTYSSTFQGCKNLTSIPEKLFENSYRVTSFSSTFSGCTGLTEIIPRNLFKNNDKVTDFSSTFSGCNNLTGVIPDDLFENNLNVTTFSGTFSGCNKLLGTIPSNLFNNNLNVTSFSSTFANCTGFTAIPVNLFNNNLNVTTFASTFAGCTGLTSIPANLFTNALKNTSFNQTFSNCRNITVIPEDIFANNMYVSSFTSVFAGCTGITEIPENLFADSYSATLFQASFKGCTGLTEIPANLFKNTNRVTSFYETFENCSNLISIPTNLFANSPRVLNFSYVFAGCRSLTGNIPSQIFSENILVTNFSYAFYNCSELTGSIPATLFSNNEFVTTFASTFYGCTGLIGNIPANLFANNTMVTSFSSTFIGCSGLTGNAPALWDTHSSVTSSSSCFYLCSGLSNYSSIPSRWR